MSGRALAAYEPCGCCAAISVLQSRQDPIHDAEYAASAYKMAADEAKAGRRIEEVDIDEWKARGSKCPEHPKGPPWWKSNGGNGKVPTDYVPQPGLGL